MAKLSCVPASFQGLSREPIKQNFKKKFTQTTASVKIQAKTINEDAHGIANN